MWGFQQNTWNKLTGGDAAETVSGPGSYDIRQSVWHVNCCNPQINGGGGWGIFNAILGWQNSATYGSVIGYNLYWLIIIVGFVALRWREKRGSWPFMKRKTAVVEPAIERKESGSASSLEQTKIARPSVQERTVSAINHTA
jgi:high-affinity iron transporter